MEARQQQVSIRSMSDRTLESLLNFIYSGQIRITRGNVQELIVAADMIELKEVVALCTQYLVNELDTSNAVGIFRFAADHNCKDLKLASRNYINDNFAAVSAGDEFLSLPRDLLVDFLSSELLRVDSEYQVFVAAMGWVEADLAGRRRFIFDTLKFVRLPLVPSRLLEAHAASCRDISLRVALDSVRKDVLMRKGSLVALGAQPRLRAKKNIFVIGGSQRELGRALHGLSPSSIPTGAPGSAWTR